MGSPDLSMIDIPIGWFRHSFKHPINTSEYARAKGFAARAITAGTYVWRSLGGEADETEDVAAGEYLGGHGAVPVALVAVRVHATITELRIGIA